MKKLFWRPSRVPRIVLVVLAIISILAMLSVELIKSEKQKPYFHEKLRAAQTMQEGMEAIKTHRLRLLGKLDPELDPAKSGLIGLKSSPVTTKEGSLRAKQTTVNPNWAGVVYEMLREAKIKPGQTVALGLSGSFPALCLATMAAAKELNLNVIAISSAGASSYGANMPDLTWLDMERLLNEKQIIPYRSVAASLGGLEDKAQGMDKESQELLRLTIFRNKVRYIEVNDLKDSIEKHMKIYREAAQRRRIAAYVNVGGSLASVGTVKAKKGWKPGLNVRPRASLLKADSVMSRFAKQGTPIIHLVYTERLAARFGLPKAPKTMPVLGEGPVFKKKGYNLYLAGANVLILILILYAFLKSDIGYRIFGSSRITQAPKHPEPMV